MGPETFLKSRKDAISIEERHANEMRVYDEAQKGPTKKRSKKSSSQQG